MNLTMSAPRLCGRWCATPTFQGLRPRASQERPRNTFDLAKTSVSLTFKLVPWNAVMRVCSACIRRSWLSRQAMALCPSIDMRIMRALLPNAQALPRESLLGSWSFLSQALLSCRPLFQECQLPAAQVGNSRGQVQGSLCCAVSFSSFAANFRDACWASSSHILHQHGKKLRAIGTSSASSLKVHQPKMRL